jgi:hypothetical protein
MEGTPTERRHRVIVSTDIGGTDPDDFQSMVHLRDFAARLDRCQSPRGPEEMVDLADVIPTASGDSMLKSRPNEVRCRGVGGRCSLERSWPWR